MYRNLAKYVEDGIVARVCITEDIRYETNISNTFTLYVLNATKFKMLTLTTQLFNQKLYLVITLMATNYFLKVTALSAKMTNKII